MISEIEDIKEGVEPMLSRLDLMKPIVEDIILGRKKLSYSALSCFIDSPKDFSDYKLKERVETPAMVYGSMVHCLVLEPGDFLKRYFPLDDADICDQIGGAKPRATKKYKEWKFGQSELANGRIIVSPNEYAHAKTVAYNVRTNRASANLLRLCPHREQGVEWEYLGLFWHGFIDMYGDDDINDLKTMPNANREVVDREIKKRRLYLQHCLYRMGDKARCEVLGIPWKKKRHHVTAVDKLGGVSVHEMAEPLMDYGMEELEFYTKRFCYAYTIEAWDQSQDFYGHPFTGRFVCEKSGYQLNAEF